MDWDLSTEKLTRAETIRAIDALVPEDYDRDGVGAGDMAVAQAAQDKLKAYQAQQTGGIQEKIRGILNKHAVGFMDKTKDYDGLLKDLSTLLSQELKQQIGFELRFLHSLGLEFIMNNPPIRSRILNQEAHLKEMNNE